MRNRPGFGLAGLFLAGVMVTGCEHSNGGQVSYNGASGTMAQAGWNQPPAAVAAGRSQGQQVAGATRTTTPAQPASAQTAGTPRPAAATSVTRTTTPAAPSQPGGVQTAQYPSLTMTLSPGSATIAWPTAPGAATPATVTAEAGTPATGVVQAGYTTAVPPAVSTTPRPAQAAPTPPAPTQPLATPPAQAAPPTGQPAQPAPLPTATQVEPPPPVPGFRESRFEMRYQQVPTPPAPGTGVRE